MSAQRGIALILVILVTSFLSAIGLGLALIVFMDQARHRQPPRAPSRCCTPPTRPSSWPRAILRSSPDWDLALSRRRDGAAYRRQPSGVRAIPGGGEIDLTAATNLLNCGQAIHCTARAMDASTASGPGAPNNARWQLYAYGPLGDFVQFARPAPCYLAVWVADDGREEDDDR